MSSDPQSPSDDEIDAYLRGDDALSKAYRAANREQPVQPSREVDEAVLAFAQQAVRSRRSLRRRWQAPMALAAVLVLGLGLVINLWREPEVRAPAAAQPAAMHVPESVAESAVVDESAVADQAAAQDQARQLAEQRALEEQRQREARRSESSMEREKQRRQMASEAAKRNAMQAAPIDAPPPPSLPAPPPPPVVAASPAPPTMRLAPRAAFAPAAAPSSSPRAKTEREALPAQSLSASPSTQEKQALASASSAAKSSMSASAHWKPARFAEFELGIATRADVVARYGDPESRGISESDEAAADAPRLHYDAYPSLPGIDGITEFYYEPISQRLLGVRVVLRKPTPAQQVADQLGWNESVQPRDWAHPPCASAFETHSNSGPNTGPKTEAPHYGVFPQHGAYLFQPAGLVEQIVFEAECAWP